MPRGCDCHCCRDKYGPLTAEEERKINDYYAAPYKFLIVIFVPIYLFVIWMYPGLVETLPVIEKVVLLFTIPGSIYMWFQIVMDWFK
jgi:hypothetical protein